MHYLLGAFLATAAALALVLLAIHLGFRAPRRVERGSPADFGLPHEEVRIATVDGKGLFAWWLPGAAAAPSVILLHGWGGNAELMLPLAAPLHAAGLNVLLPDARNHGRSDPASFSSMPRFAEDVGAAIAWLRAQPAPRPNGIVLLGHSVGAAAVLLEASRRSDIAAVISIAAFAHPEWMMRRQLQRLGLPAALADGVLRYVEWIIGHRYDDIAPINTCCRVGCPVLLVHGGADDTVPVADALAIRDHCRSASVELLLIDEAGHNSVDMIERHGDRLLAFLHRAGVVDRA